MFNSYLRTPPFEASEFNESRDYFSSKPKLSEPLYNLSTSSSSCSLGSSGDSAEEREAPQMISPVEKDDNVRTNPNDYKFLVLDDNYINLKILSRMLSKLYPNAVIDTLQDSREALDKISSVKYDVVFLDIEMPHVSGTELASTIRNIEDHKRLGLIAVTTRYMRESLLLYERLGIDFTFSKPLNYSYEYISGNIELVMEYRMGLEKKN
ncbi:uncharacterized protein PRCAT00000457001 [Priceomyces carsonii]|uniref:uncharacterized protein n=1 Tax=Priceomyces carsonii TaxID=28549 RepID=UPI002ED89859|nr:unnamed protein product [Priceomyces carsonii]